MSGCTRTAFLLLAVIGLAACAPQVREAGPRAGAPDLDRFFVAGDGEIMVYRAWLPDNPGHRAPPKAAIVALHGYNDHSRAFTAAAEYWAARGIATYAYDQRGFGGSHHPGIWAGIEAMAVDAAEFVALVRAKHPEAPVYLLGSSMGGAVAMEALTGPNPPAVDGAILAAPAVWGRQTMPTLYTSTLWLAAHSLPDYVVTARGIKRTPSDNIEMLRDLGRDPRVIKGSRVDALYGLVNLMGAALESASDLRTPTLVLYGENDDIVPAASTRRMVERLPKGHRIALYGKGYHMLLRDLQAETVYRDVAAWIADRDAPLPSGADQGDALETLEALARD